MCLDHIPYTVSLMAMVVHVAVGTARHGQCMCASHAWISIPVASRWWIMLLETMYIEYDILVHVWVTC